MRIIFMGTAELSCPSLEALAAKFSVVAVVTQPDRPRGRELKLLPPPVKVLAERLGLRLFQPARARDEKFIAELRALAPDLIAVVAYGHILPQTILELPRYGCLNVHMSLLPKYRGAAPIQWAVANGETETGVTIMKMDAGLDTGTIIAQHRAPIQAADDSVTLHERLAHLGAELLAQIIPDYAAGKIRPEPQPAEGVSLAPKIKKENGRIDWNLPAQTILNRLRAFTPWPGAFAFLPDMVGRASTRAETETSERPAGTLAPRKQLLKIWKAEIAGQAGKPGEIMSVDKSGIVVGCGAGALQILELQPEGGRRMSATEFLAGYRLKPGDRFES